jgi:hypothetical protein
MASDNEDTSTTTSSNSYCLNSDSDLLSCSIDNDFDKNADEELDFRFYRINYITTNGKDKYDISTTWRKTTNNSKKEITQGENIFIDCTNVRNQHRSKVEHNIESIAQHNWDLLLDLTNRFVRNDIQIELNRNTFLDFNICNDKQQQGECLIDVKRYLKFLHETDKILTTCKTQNHDLLLKFDMFIRTGNIRLLFKLIIQLLKIFNEDVADDDPSFNYTWLRSECRTNVWAPLPVK